MLFKLILAVISVSAIVLSGSYSVYAQPYGMGLYNADVPYGGATQMSLATGGAITIPITPNTSGVLGTNSGTVTVTSEDVVGYKLYIRALSNSNLTTPLGAVLGASSNVTALPLATNTWGYNTSGSTTNFIGATTSDQLVKTQTGPYKNGDITTFTYGVKVNLAKPAGNYSTTILYTALPQTN
ncbi:MAG: hypothetical protein JWM52_290 [Candidatus Saccharibacteria bacterium]|nr:hypothetical protein [Candidatus Saccharibacteria bacterium]